MIRRARREDIPLLMELWQASFGDCMEYISFFFKIGFLPRKRFFMRNRAAQWLCFFCWMRRFNAGASHIPPDIFMPPARRRRSVGVG